ncbi:MAG TPA: hypothetical protein VMV68_07320 [Spirochaetia bacterium]|nr:hypothetical protein [Spirochaetia bacterium]
MRTSGEQYLNHEIEDARRLKHSTVNLCTGVELVLKARLAQEHWTLVLMNADRYRNGDWERGSFQAVGLSEAKSRLSEVCAVHLSEQAEAAFTALSDLRNKFLHFVVSESAARVTGIQLRAWHHAIDLLDQDFLPLSDVERRELQAIREQMRKREEYLDAQFEVVSAAITERANDGSDVILCPFCAHSALLVGDGAICLVCGSGQSEPRAYAEECARQAAPWMSSDEYYGTQWAAICTECGQQACIASPEALRSQCTETLIHSDRIERDADTDVEPWYCFNCGAVFDSLDIVECTRCGQLFGRSNDESLCPNCSW